MKALAYISYLLIFCLVSTEIVLRIYGYMPFDAKHAGMKFGSIRGDAYKPDSTFVIALNDGSYDVIINSGCLHRVSHKGGNRITSLEEKSDSNAVLFLGCSYTYGMGVNDTETFCSLLSKKNTGFKIINMARPGLSNLHSAMMLKEYIDIHTTPKLVMFSLSYFHFDRNVLSNMYRKTLYDSYQYFKDRYPNSESEFRIAYMNSKYKVDTVKLADVYHPIPGRSYLASIYLFENVLDEYLDKQNNALYLSINKFILNDLIKYCDSRNIPLVFYDYYIDNLADGLKELIISHHKKMIEMNIDWSPALENEECNDPHPNKAGHSAIAKQFQKYIFDIYE